MHEAHRTLEGHTLQGGELKRQPLPGMGAGASTMSPTSVGKFQLTADQKKQNEILSNLFLALLQNNNLVDLSKLVARSDKECNQLIITLSSQLEKEFQSLRFPDPSRQKTDITASYMAQDRYRILSDNPDSTRKQVCSFLATFLLRFVLLISALTASISITDAIPVLTKTAKVPTLLNAKDRTPVKAFIPSVPYSKLVMNLKESRFATAVEPDTKLFLLDNQYFLDLTGGFLYKKGDTLGQTKALGVEMGYKPIEKQQAYGMPGQPTQKRILSQFNPQEEYGRELEETKRQLALVRQQQQPPAGYQGYPGYSSDYERQRQQQRILEDEIVRRRGLEERLGRLETQTVAQQSIRPNSNQQSDMQTVTGMSQVPSMATAATNATTSSYTSQFKQNIARSERGELRSTETSKQEDVSYIMMIRFFDLSVCSTISDSCLSSSGGLISEFYMDDYGKTYDVQAYEASRGRLEPQFSIPFANRVEDALNRTSTEYIVGERESDASTTQQTTSKKQMDFQLHEETIQYLRKIEMRGADIVAPAAFRAYLLATEVYSATVDGRNEQHLRYSFCKDSWSKKSLDEIPAYGLLAGLFKDYDNREGRMLGMAAAFDEVRNKMKTEGILEEGSDLTNWKTKFPDVPDGLCNGKPEYYVINPENKARIQVLQAAHTKLRAMYDAHLRAVVEFIKTVLVVDDTFLQSLSRPGRYLEEALAAPVLRLHPRFSADPVGSFNVIQERSNAARKLLSDHYFQVEKLYKDTLKQLNDLALGIGTVAKGGRRRTRKARKATKATKPSYKSTRGKRTRRV